ncbi:DUF6303 family protein, partial [Streptomyces sp. NPDC004981]|uniref:DUF6303 family protein n=1 Tax=Streptomyces sp. NPDC004981 TaxID=3156655 RepID=UPI0033BAB8E7
MPASSSTGGTTTAARPGPRGRAFTDGAEWEWTEYSETPGDDASPVRLLAS